MRRNQALMALAIVGFVGLSMAPAHATRCIYPERSVTGPIRSTFGAAQNAAIGAWQASANKKHGRRFSNWYYSGDRSLTCQWNDRGNRIKCRASAVPCGE